MTPPSDDQTDNNRDIPDFDKTVTLLCCEKHGITYLETEFCPQCDEEKNHASETGRD
jgi:hypothetical protein